MAENRWEERYQTGETGWDAGSPAPALVEWVAATERTFRHALAPGVGRGYDLWELAKIARRVTGLDIAPATKLFFDAPENQPEEATTTPELRIADFFEFDENVDLVWDYTFLCAIDPSLRPAWVKKMSDIVEPGGTLLALLFPVDPDWGVEGPPFKLDPDDITELLSEKFERRALTVPTSSHSNREGREYLAQFVRRST